MDDLTRSMGNVSFYYQGRIIENIRISNTVDAYAVNGWESMKLENHSGIVDNYRFPKGDPEVMARYNAPLYLAVKMNRQGSEYRRYNVGGHLHCERKESERFLYTESGSQR